MKGILSIGRLVRLVNCILLFCLSITAISAHPFTYSICKLYIGEQYISGNLEVAAENLIFFDYLQIDSTNKFSSIDIISAANAYTQSLSSSLFLKSADDQLVIENFIMSELSLKEKISIAELNEIFLSYSFTIKLDQALDQLDIMHKIGENYPLISSLLILEIEGVNVDKSFDNLSNNQFYRISFKDNHKEKSSLLSIEQLEKELTFKLVTNKEFLDYAIGGVENLNENKELLSEIFSLKSDDSTLPFTNIRLNKTSEKDVLITAETIHSSGSSYRLEWKKFSKDVKSISAELISENTTKTCILTRYERTLSW